MEGPDPGGDDNAPTVTIVHRIKCKLGYAELHKPAPGFGPGEEVGVTSPLQRSIGMYKCTELLSFLMA